MKSIKIWKKIEGSGQPAHGTTDSWTHFSGSSFEDIVNFYFCRIQCNLYKIKREGH